MGSATSPLTMKAILLLLSLVLASAFAAPDSRFTCSECVNEMRHLGHHVYEGAHPIHDYLVANYCPTVHDQEFCVERLSRYYIHMLFAIVNHYFVDGALHICQTMGTCAPRNRKYTCDECVEGLEWVEVYLKDPIIVAEYVVYLEHNFCLDEWTDCREHVKNDFPAMHEMAMQKFFIPVEICNREPECGASTHPPSHHPTHGTDILA